MTRRIILAAAAAAISASAVVVPGAIKTSAAVKIPPACVEHQIGPAHLEVGYCPHG
jgi:hypothetical protein